jgi:hypothetical protein
VLLQKPQTGLKTPQRLSGGSLLLKSMSQAQGRPRPWGMGRVWVRVKVDFGIEQAVVSFPKLSFTEINRL